MQLVQAPGTAREILLAVASELQVPVDEFENDDVEFSELGVDALVAPVIVARIAQATAIRLPEDVFQTFQTVGAFRQHVATLASTRRKADPALSIMIRSSTTKDSRNLFLLPDGSGAAMAYARLPTIPNVCIYAMNSPFLKAASNYTCSIEQLAPVWAEAITRIQPHGPYMLGGWSAGGYYAYEVMKHLIERKGQVVDKLVLIDSPCRTDFEALPLDVVLYVASSGLMMRGDTTPQWLVDHFGSTLKAVAKYTPERLTPSLPLPTVFIIWASEPLLDQSQAEAAGLDPSAKVTRLLLLQPRSVDFGPNGWEKLFPGQTDMMISTVPCNHFNIVQPPNADMLGSLLRDVVAYTNTEDNDTMWENKWRRIKVSNLIK